MPETGEPLSDRELDVLTYMVQGASNKEIAAQLVISENTVKVHLRRIYAKLGASSRTEATALALQKGLVTLPGLESLGETVSESATESPSTATAVSRPEVPTLTEATFAPTETPTAVSPPPAAPAPTSPSWRALSLGLALLAIAIMLGLLIWQQNSSAGTVAATPTEVAQPFTEQPLGDSRWLLSRPMPAARAGMGIAAIGLDIYLIGGEGVAGVVNDVDVYNTTQRQWQRGVPKPTAVADVTAAVLFGEIYLPGGRDADGRPTAVVEVYSPANNLWRNVSPLPVPLIGGLALEEGGHLYFFGGWDGKAYVNTAYKYDPALDTWQVLPPMTHARAYTAGGTIGSALYVVGGFDGESELSDCAVFDTNENGWRDCPPLLQKRAGAGGVVLLNKLYVLGGGLQPESAILYGEEYNPATQSWHTLDTPMLRDAGHWRAPAVTNVETRIYAFGGRQGETLLADTFVLRAVFQTFLPAFPAQP